VKRGTSGDAAPLAATSAPLSLNALLLTPARVRWRALRELWWYRSYWRLPSARTAMRLERDTELAAMAPILLLIALMVAALMFVVLPQKLGEQATEALSTLWPIWVIHIAPMLCALTMAMLNAPGIALQLTEREAAGEFTGADSRDLRTRSALAAHLCVPLIVAHAAVCVACTFLVVFFVLVFGLLAQLVLAVGDIRNVADLVFARISPLAWLHTALSAWALGLVCVLSAVVYAWPGTQITQRGLDAHRLGLRAMMVSAIACVVAGVAFNWVAVLLG
jgi:hypothetical protein